MKKRDVLIKQTERPNKHARGLRLLKSKLSKLLSDQKGLRLSKLRRDRLEKRLNKL